METRHRALIASQPAAWPLLQEMLEEVVDLVPVHTMREAVRILEHNPPPVDLIVCTLTFSDHHMLEFLLKVKGDPRTSAIPFIVCRALVGRLAEKLVERMGAVAKQCGAEFINLPQYPPREAADALRAVVMKCF
jgi:PleD family two-component response regulator